MDWYGFKEWLEMSSGLDMDALHIHAGVACQIAAALILRRPLASAWPWLVVVLVVAANEYYDLRYDVWPTRDDMPNRDDQFAESIKDGWNTLLVPTALMLLARYAPGLLVGKPARSQETMA